MRNTGCNCWYIYCTKEKTIIESNKEKRYTHCNTQNIFLFILYSHDMIFWHHNKTTINYDEGIRIVKLLQGSHKIFIGRLCGSREKLVFHWILFPIIKRNIEQIGTNVFYVVVMLYYWCFVGVQNYTFLSGIDNLVFPLIS